jgi:hypothetical protein
MWRCFLRCEYYLVKNRNYAVIPCVLYSRRCGVYRYLS